MSPDEKEERPITVRGIDRELYNKLKSIANELGKTVGEVFNEAMKFFLESSGIVAGYINELREDVISIRNLGELEVTGREIRESDKRIMFIGLDKLVLKDIDKDALDKIYRIINVKELEITGDINRLKLYSKCYNVSKIILH